MMEATAPLGKPDMLTRLDMFDQCSHADCNGATVYLPTSSFVICFLSAVMQFQFICVHHIQLDIIQRDNKHWSEMQLQLFLECGGLNIGFPL